MEEQTDDSIDSLQIDGIGFNKDQSERASCKFCNSITLPRSEILLFTRAILIFIKVFTT